VAIFTCTRYSSPGFLYPENARGEPFPVSTQSV
jgi:hypothetical protein